MLAFLLGMQGGYTKYSCLLCIWDSRDYANHYTKKVWPSRPEAVPGKYNIQHPPLITKEKSIIRSDALEVRLH